MKNLQTFNREDIFKKAFKDKALPSSWTTLTQDDSVVHYEVNPKVYMDPVLHITVKDSTDTAVVLLTYEANEDVEGSIVWSCNLSSDIVLIEGANLRFLQHYEGEIELTATADNASDTKTINVRCDEEIISTSYTLGEVSPIDDVASTTTSTTVNYTVIPTYHYQLKTITGNPIDMEHDVEFEENYSEEDVVREGSFIDEYDIEVNWRLVQKAVRVQQNSEVWYTSSDDRVVNPYSATAFGGAKILSNEYRDGQGIITFDRVLTTVGKNAFYNCSNLTSVEIPNSITTIDSSAFQSCVGLTSIEIPDSVTTIGESAFSGCTGLISVTIPSSVTRIGGSAFYDCPNIQNIYITDVAAWCNITGLNYLMYYGAAYKHLYLNGEEIFDLVIPDSILAIYECAFKNCKSLTSVIIPDSVVEIRSNAFQSCLGLTSVEIGNSVTTIGSSAFYYCSRLTSVTIPDSVTTISVQAFYYCSGLTSVEIGNSVTSIGLNAFSYCSKIQNIYITDLTAWCKISGLNNIMSYGSANKHLFLNGEEMFDLVIPDSVTVIGQYTFSNCSRLKSVNIPDSITTIGESAFSGCTGLISVTIPSSVTSIGNYAFRYCSKLQDIYITDLTAWCKISGLSNLMSYGSANRHLFLNGEEVFDLVIPDSVTAIGSSAFQYCSSLTSVNIPDSVTTISVQAFYGCSKLTSLSIPDSVTTIGNYAFKNVPHIEYHGTATGSPWGATSIN